MTPEFVYHVLTTVAVCGTLYGGIRADLRSQRESIARAHERLDSHIEAHK